QIEGVTDSWKPDRVTASPQGAERTSAVAKTLRAIFREGRAEGERRAQEGRGRGGACDARAPPVSQTRTRAGKAAAAHASPSPPSPPPHAPPPVRAFAEMTRFAAAAAVAAAVAALCSAPPAGAAFFQTVFGRQVKALTKTLAEAIADPWSSVSHPAFPSYKVRVLEPKGYCDPGVEQKSGYFDIDGKKHFVREYPAIAAPRSSRASPITPPVVDFITKEEGGTANISDATWRCPTASSIFARQYFHFFESRSDPKTDPFVLWLNGGPGCSSMVCTSFPRGRRRITGLYMENGPCRVREDGSVFSLQRLTTTSTDGTPMSTANVIFLDQPLGAGFSFGSGGAWDTDEAARDVYAFFQVFFREYPKYAKASFHIWGESYGGFGSVSSQSATTPTCHLIRRLPFQPDTTSPVSGITLTSRTKLRMRKGSLRSTSSVAEGHVLVFCFQSVGIGNGVTDPAIQFGYSGPM
ncbi:MAG: Alpha/Beta hydrolase protein, partial [Olpidium bornovanus]